MSDSPHQSTGAEVELSEASAPNIPKDLDLTKEQASDSAHIISQDLHKEKWRGPLAAVLVGATVAIPLLCLIAIVFGVDATELKEISQVLYPPLVGLVGAVIGFYFGDRRSG